MYQKLKVKSILESELKIDLLQLLQTKKIHVILDSQHRGLLSNTNMFSGKLLFIKMNRGLLFMG